jgi:hypothetical protein
MTNEPKRPDNRAVNDAMRAALNASRVHWNPSTSLDPAERAADRAALNRAVRRAAGKDAPEPEEGPGTYPWRSITPDDEPDDRGEGAH